MKRKFVVVVLSFALLFCFAQVVSAGEDAERIIIKVEGLYCPFCAYGLEKHMKKIEGFKDIQVNIKEGTAEIDFEPGTKVSKDDIEEAVDDAGFSLSGLTWIEKGITK